MMFLKRYSKFFACFGIIFCLLSFVPQNVFGQTPQPTGGRSGSLGNGPAPQTQVQQPAGGRSGNLGGDTASTQCHWTTLHNCFWSFLNWAAEVWLTFLGWFLAMAGFVLNFTIDFTILNLKTTIDNPAISEIWTIIRDLVNIGMIFMVLYIAILTIVQANASATKKMLGGIIFVAIFVNFSLFTTKVLIDASNRVTLVFYNAIVATTEQGTDGNTYGGTPTGTLGGSIAGIVLNQLNLKTFYRSNASFEENVLGLGIGAANNSQQTNPTTFSRFGSIAIGLIGGSIYIVVAIYTFLAISLMLLIRFATIVLLLVFSPAGFLLGVTSGLNNNWWKELWKNLLFPPAMFLMLWVSIYILNSTIKGGQNDAEWFNALTNMQSVTSSLFVKFFLAIVLLLASMIIANQIGARGAAQLQSWVNKSSKSMLGGWAGFAGRNLIGGAGKALGNVYDNQIGNKLFTRSETLKNISSDPKNNRLLRFGAGALGNVVGGINTIGTRTVRSGLAQVEGGKYGSARSLKEEEDLLRKEKFTQRAVEERIRKEKDVELYAELQDGLEKKEVELNGLITKVGDLENIEAAALKVEEDRSIEERKLLQEIRDKIGSGDLNDGLAKLRSKRDEVVDDYYKNNKVADRAGTKGGVAMADIAKKFSKLGDKDIEMMLEENPSLATDSKFLRMLSPDQVKGLTKREGVTAGEIGEIKNNYKDAMKRASKLGNFGRMDAMGIGELSSGLDPDALTTFLNESITSGISSGKLGSKITGRTLSAIASGVENPKDRDSIDMTMQRLIDSTDGRIIATGKAGEPFRINPEGLTGKEGEAEYLNQVIGIMNWYRNERKAGTGSVKIKLPEPKTVRYEAS